MKQRVLVCGGRTFNKRQLLFDILDLAHDRNPIVLLIHGAASGADRLAGEWAKERGVPTNEYRADWDRHGRAAGPIRNKQMLDEAKPDLVIAFPGSVGTANMVAQAEGAGIPVARIRP